MLRAVMKLNIIGSRTLFYVSFGKTRALMSNFNVSINSLFLIVTASLNGITQSYNLVCSKGVFKE